MCKRCRQGHDGHDPEADIGPGALQVTDALRGKCAEPDLEKACKACTRPDVFRVNGYGRSDAVWNGQAIAEGT